MRLLPSILAVPLLLLACLVSAQPATPVPAEPSSGSSYNVGSDITYSWAPVVAADAYDFFIYNRATASIAYRDSNYPAANCSNTVCAITPPSSALLPVSSDHVWRAAAKEAGLRSNFSYIRFNILDPSGTPPQTPAALAPPNNSNQDLDTDIVYQWTESTDATSYDFFVYDRSTSSILFRNRTVSSDICSANTCSYNPGAAAHLPLGNDHVWRVAAQNAFGSSSYTYSRFNIVSSAEPPPDRPTPISPINTSVTSGNLTFTWSSQANTSNYDFFVYDRNQASIVFRDTNFPASECNESTCIYTLSNQSLLSVGDNHVWRVAAINPGGRSDYSYSRFSLGELAQNSDPIARAGIDVSINLGQSVTLDGSTSTDPDGSISSFQWNDNNGNSIGSSAITAWTPTSEGSFTVTLTVTDNLDATNSDTLVVTVEPDQPPPPLPLSGYNLVFEDNFNGSALDAAKWNTGLLWGPYLPINNEEQLYVDTLGMHQDFNHTPFNFTGSSLMITATEVGGNLQPPVRPVENDPVWGQYGEYRFNAPEYDSEGNLTNPGYLEENVNYLSGIITSYDAFKMSHGYVETRAKVPAGRGLWPAFWLLNTHYVEDSPEIDVMEFLGQDTDTMYHTYHYFDVPAGWAKISTPSYITNHADWTQDFHTFGMAWSPREIIWYVDGVEVQRVDDSQYKIAGQAMYLLANLAVGGNWPGAPDGNTSFPATYEIDYIRAYKKDLREPVNLADYQLMFSDEFSGSSINTNKWNTHFGWGPYKINNNEQQYYVDAEYSDADKSYSPFSFQNGSLRITADLSSNSAADVPPAMLPAENDSIWDNYPFQRDGAYTQAPDYTSGVITSFDGFKFANGYVEIRARVPAGDGLWPTLGIRHSYFVGPLPIIDIASLRGESPSQIVHSYTRNNSSGLESRTEFFSNGGSGAAGFGDDYHVFGLSWRLGQLTWYLDGTPVHTHDNSDSPYQLMHIVANLAVGGDFPLADVDPAMLPAHMDIDYIRVYQETSSP